MRLFLTVLLAMACAGCRDRQATDVATHADRTSEQGSAETSDKQLLGDAPVEETSGDEATGDESDPNRIYGALSTLNVDGRPGGLKLNLGGKDRFYIEGNTQALAAWQFEGVTDDTFADPAGIPVALQCKPFRSPPYTGRCFPHPGDRRGVVVMLHVRNPSTGRSSSPIFELLPVGRNAEPLVWQIPRKVEGIDAEGNPQEYDLMTDFVSDGRLEIIVRSQETGVFLGVRERDLYLPRDAGQTTGSDRAVDAPSEDKTAPIDDPYGHAIAACHQAWQDYEDAVFEFENGELDTNPDTNEGKATQRGIFLADEIRIGEKTNEVLRQCLAGLRSRLDQSSDGRLYIQVAAVSSLLGETHELMWLLSEAAELDEAHRPLYLYVRSGQSFLKTDFENAKKDLIEALRLQPDNDDAYDSLKMICEQLGETVPDDLKRAEDDKPADAGDDEPIEFTDSTICEMQRTLPWITIHTFDDEIRGLTRSVNARMVVDWDDRF